MLFSEVISVNYNSLGERIRIARTTKKLTQERLAEKIGVSTNFISQIERGISKMSVKSIVLIADALGTSVDSLLGRVTPIDKNLIPGVAGEMYELLKKMSIAQRQFVLNHAKQLLDLVEIQP